MSTRIMSYQARKKKKAFYSAPALLHTNTYISHPFSLQAPMAYLCAYMYVYTLCGVGPEDIRKTRQNIVYLLNVYIYIFEIVHIYRYIYS